MYGVLEKLGFPKTDDCMVKMEQHGADGHHEVANANANTEHHVSTNGGISVEGMHKKDESLKRMHMRGASLKGASTPNKSSTFTKETTSKMKGTSTKSKSGDSSKMAMPSSKMKGKKS